MIGVVNDPRVAAAVGQILGGAAADIRARGNDSASAEEYGGERATAEPSYTDEFVYQFRHGVAIRLEHITSELRDRGANIRIEFHATNLPVGEESRFGADIGVRTTLRSDDAVLVKGALFQCKRLYGPSSRPSYPELRGRGEQQAKDMLRMTPASFFMLYNFGTQRQLLNWASIPTATICPMDGQSDLSTEGYRDWQQLSHLARIWRRHVGYGNRRFACSSRAFYVCSCRGFRGQAPDRRSPYSAWLHPVRRVHSRFLGSLLCRRYARGDRTASYSASPPGRPIPTDWARSSERI